MESLPKARAAWRPTSGESPKAQIAAVENNKKADAFLTAVKAFLHEGDTVKSTGYRIMPLNTYGDRGKKPAITGYRASNSFLVKSKYNSVMAIVSANITGIAINIIKFQG